MYRNTEPRKRIVKQKHRRWIVNHLWNLSKIRFCSCVFFLLTGFLKIKNFHNQHVRANQEDAGARTALQRVPSDEQGQVQLERAERAREE